MTVFGYREVRGCIPIIDSQTKFRIYWRPITETNFVFFVRIYNKDWSIWIPHTSHLKIYSGGTRKLTYDNDPGIDGYHTVFAYQTEDDSKFLMSFEMKDYRGFQQFTYAQLSNFEGELTEENVE